MKIDGPVSDDAIADDVRRVRGRRVVAVVVAITDYGEWWPPLGDDDDYDASAVARVPGDHGGRLRRVTVVGQRRVTRLRFVCRVRQVFYFVVFFFFSGRFFVYFPPDTTTTVFPPVGDFPGFFFSRHN